MKKILSLLLALCLLCGTVVWAEELPVEAKDTARETGYSWSVDAETGGVTPEGYAFYAPAAYVSGGSLTDAVVNGYCAQTAPVLVVTGNEISVAAALKKGYTVLQSSAETLGEDIAWLTSAEGLPCDTKLIVAIGSDEGSAAVYDAAATAEVYAGVVYNPQTTGFVEDEELAEAYATGLSAYLQQTYKTGREDGPNIVYTIDEDGARSFCEANAPAYTVDYETLTASAEGVSFGEVAAAGSEPVSLGYKTYYYIRSDYAKVSSASAALAATDALRAAGSVVNCAVAWTAMSDSDLFDWIDRVCRFEYSYEPEEVETLLDLQNAIEGGTYSWKAGSSVYTISCVTASANPELEDYQGLSIAIPAAYISGIAEDGSLIIDWEAEITSPNGAVYTAATAPIVINTGAAGYSASTTGNAGGTYASYGYINVACGNRGKNNVCTDAEGNTYYTGDAPYCLVDQKAVVRWLKYNISLGNICGSADRIVSTGGSGGGAHSLMLAATGNHPDFYPYLQESGAVGAYYDADSDSYYATISDAIWGCCPYSPITNLAEADMAYEWESLISLTALDYIEASDFKRALSSYLAEEYIDYVNALGLVYDLDGDGVAEEMTLSDDGLSGTYVDFMVAQAESDLVWFLEHIESVTLSVDWQNQNGESKAEAYFYGHYAYTQSIDGLELSG